MAGLSSLDVTDVKNGLEQRSWSDSFLGPGRSTVLNILRQISRPVERRQRATNIISAPHSGLGNPKN